MLNIGGGEFVVILLVALVILGPTKLPEAARQVGKVLGEFRNLSAGFQRELKDAMNDPVERATREGRNDVVSTANPPPMLETGEPAATSESSEAADPVDASPTGDDGDGGESGDAPSFGDR